MARIARRPLLGGLAALAAAARPAGAQQAEANSTRLGALFPFTGPLALLGDEHFRGLELAAEERNVAGGLLGKPIRLVKGDAADPAQATAEAKRLMGAERALVLFGTCASPLSFAATQAAELQGVPYVELGAVADPITERGFRLLFRTAPRASEIGRIAVDAIADLLAPAWGLPPEALKIALLHEDSLYGQSVAAAEEAQLKARGLPIAEKLGYTLRSLEAAPIVQRLRGMAADVLLHVGYQNDILLLYRGLREAGWRPRMVIGAGAGYSLVDTAHAIGPEFEGTLNVDVPQFEVNDRVAPGVKPFLELYRKRYGSEPRSGHSLANYVGARAAFDAIQRANAPDRDRIRAALAATDVPEGGTANGWGIRFDEKGQNQRARPLLLQWQGGRLVAVAPAEAATAPLKAQMGAVG
ncbi:ABC transporter substrate-binding protein [Paracraurococcus lichenis]|uniref:ABC transporter substrate-binding protein n=1 Tax=Paracraurococcus lichenis TaxID=3064888 RepID=A0ABT9E067_9PROT|nr:ABC transporter substrate-binding protein [Paracraurococcus sp. LOR1-02]MDO9709556.1 ABC transporter substrate-binding protein [Paracraurococcus sp. LOR1-02]